MSRQMFCTQYHKAVALLAIALGLSGTVKADDDKCLYKYQVSLNGSTNLARETKDYKIATSIPISLTGIGISLENKSRAEIQIDWNKSSIIGFDKRAMPVMHNGVKFMDRAAPKVPSVVPPGAVLDDTAVPIESVKFLSRSWTTRPLLPPGPPKGNPGLDAALNNAAKEMVIGKSFSLYLSLIVGGKPKSETLVFTVKNIDCM